MKLENVCYHMMEMHCVGSRSRCWGERFSEKRPGFPLQDRFPKERELMENIGSDIFRIRMYIDFIESIGETDNVWQDSR